MQLTERLVQQLQAHADSARAVKMQAYMKTQQAFFGVPAPLRKQLFKQAIKEFPVRDADEYREAILALWHGSHREMQYQALEVAEHGKNFRTSEQMPLYESLLDTAENWDTVDWIATSMVGLLIKSQLELRSWLIKWRVADNLWLRRASLIAHLKHKQQTDVNLLAETILMLASEREFFIRKAIGWVLREYGKTNPIWVRDFVQAHQSELSGLSQREALKHINKSNN
ncbi:DNA alkylation repair protein [Planctobacterium marinum]|uniref:DNA alkylation repair protein n=1 Tax=Planctobacterium marinum TaxID=1631968 RepID=A0AA48HWZ5_9ALTE|nr:hypothetical protein MACH26_29290 [Planctobacterium marinum]